MIQWWQDVVNEWDWFVFIPEALGKATGVVIGISTTASASGR